LRTREGREVEVCGLTGWADRAGSVSQRAVEVMSAALSHRGPDGCGVWGDKASSVALAHRRLAILDLSDAAAQPIANEDGTAFLVYNGEIYNHLELRRDLERAGHRFHSRTDSEAILHGWEEWGIDGIVERLRGMFAFALWDDKARRLFLVRDRLGIKPLYVATLSNGGLAFASEAKALLAHPAIARRLDPRGVRAYLSYGYVPAEATVFAGIRKLRAGWLLEWHDGRETERRYWELEYRPQGSAPALEDAAVELRRLLAETVEMRLQADVPVGAFLSGGIDSSTVTALAAKAYPEPVSTFCVAFPEMRDEDILFARLATGALGTDHHELALREAEARTLLARLPAILDEPLYDAAVLPTYLVSRLARSHIKVVLSGTGGDEVFGGYAWVLSQVRYAEQRRRLGPFAAPLTSTFAALTPRLRRMPPWNRLPAGAKVLGATRPERSFYMRGFFDAHDQRRLLGDASLRPPDDAEHLWLYQRFARPEWPLVPALLYHDLRALIPDNELVIVDRMTMAHGLEARVPLLDHRLVEWVFSLPWEYLLDNGVNKRLLRLAAAPLLPAAIIGRRKAGFSPPFKQWVGNGRAARTRRELAATSLVSDGIVDAAGLRRTVGAGALRRPNKMWSLLNLEAWYRQWIRRDPVVPEGTPLNAL
jgi:asparagine synthase (glutamine-hydrolysing)